MAPSQVTDDYYKILGITQSAGKDAIRASYKRLALKYHPDRNSNNPQATAQFQLLEAAYSTLFDPERRRIYDIQYASIKLRYPTTPDTNKNNPPPQANNKSSESSQIHKLQIEKLEKALEELHKRRNEVERELFKATRECNTSQTTLDKLEADANRDAQEEANRNGWFGYFFSSQQSEEDKQARQRRMVDNRAARTVREAELKRRKACVATAQSSLDDLDIQIQKKTSEKIRLQQREWQRQEAVRLAEAARIAEIRRQQATQREKEMKAREEAERIRREEQEERVRKELEAERLRRAQEAERVRNEQEAERVRRAKEARKEGEEILRRYREEMLKKNPSTREPKHPGKQTKASGEKAQRGKGFNAENIMHGQSARASAGRTSSCLHRSWWNQEEGRHACERCLTTTSRFAFRCPSCQIVACAGCRNILKGRV